jgi:hypothetical protein
VPLPTEPYDAAAGRAAARRALGTGGAAAHPHGTFVVISVLQIVLGLDAFQAGTHLLALSVAMLVIALLGPRTAARRSPRTVAQLGLVAVSIGAIVMLATREWKARALRGCCFGWRVMVCGRRAPPAVRLRAGLAVGSLTPRAPRWRERAPG